MTPFFLSWSSFNAYLDDAALQPKCISYLLPLLKESSSEPSVVMHGLKTILHTTKSLNPGQTPVACIDQPLFAIAKQIQWIFHSSFCEDKLFIFFAGLHLEKQAIVLVFDLMAESGWMNHFIVKAGLGTSGAADSLIRISSIENLREFLQILLVELHMLKEKAFQIRNDLSQSFGVWEKEMKKATPMFFGDLIMSLILNMLELVKSIRTRDWTMYVDVVERIAPWFSVFDHFSLCSLASCSLMGH